MLQNKKLVFLTWLLLALTDVLLLTFWFVDVEKWVEILFGGMSILLTAAVVIISVIGLSEASKREKADVGSRREQTDAEAASADADITDKE
ncbi:MAG TPA: hypothetical protein P5161_05825 [Eubacteriales bacterium]|jgi:hypothetical protein|nr:hypothetical protein [Clostridia bacterium]HRR90277.1 hypothetical protein [Eubacteriales bacterium]HRU84676.1 hypothetical protein [Eubacteriales bacterium]